MSESDLVKRCIVYSDGDSVKNLRVFHNGKLFFEAAAIRALAPSGEGEGK